MELKRIIRVLSRYGFLGVIGIICDNIRKKYIALYNRLRLKMKGVRYGKNVQIYNKLYLCISRGGKLIIGDNFKFTSGGGINVLCRNIRGAISIEDKGVIRIGNNTGISSACLWAKEKIEIGNNVKIGGDCLIIDTDAHSLDYRVRCGEIKDENGNPMDSKSACSKPIIIEDHVLIGTRCIILKGVTIGARSVIGAGSVVTKSIPSDCIAAGNPCKVIKLINQAKNETN